MRFDEIFKPRKLRWRTLLLRLFCKLPSWLTLDLGVLRLLAEKQSAERDTNESDNHQAENGRSSVLCQSNGYWHGDSGR